MRERNRERKREREREKERKKEREREIERKSDRERENAYIQPCIEGNPAPLEWRYKLFAQREMQDDWYS